jgi:putative nucleotidyltransferase with HDIG domain
MRARERGFRVSINTYVFAVAACGFLVVAASAVDLLQQGPQYRSQWLALVALTVVSGVLPITLPTVSASISISETFLIAGTLLFGRPGGTVLVLLDALCISLYLLWSRGLRWQQVVFNLSAPPLSIWLAATVVGVEALFRTNPAFNALFIIQVAAFAILYFAINTWLITFAISLQKNVPAREIWWKHFRELLITYTAGASIAALLIYNTREIQPEFVAAIVPLLVVLFLTYQWSNKRVEVERERNADLNRVFLSTIEALALAIDAKDQVTHGHIRRVQRYTMALAEALGITDDKQLDAIRAGALLHDTGKLAVPEYILNKPGPLTPSEYERMKVHAAVGADILKSIDFPYPVEPIVRHHHENWNGSGYPEGLSGQDIPLGARILSVVDCYDALTSDRPYRPRYSRQHAEQVLIERRGTWYDPWVVDTFLRILDRLERMDVEEAEDTSTAEPVDRPSAQLEVIVATTAEEREFNELRRDLPLASDVAAGADVLFRHLRRILPASSFALFVCSRETNDLGVVACVGIGSPVIEGMQIPVGERISGWVFAHKQAVVNSNAALELGPVARGLAIPLRYALSVPILNGGQTPLGVLTCYGSEPFTSDHRRILEAAATLFVSNLSSSAPRTAKSSVPPQPVGSRVH